MKLRDIVFWSALSAALLAPVTVAVTQASTEGDGIITADLPAKVTVSTWHPAIFVRVDGEGYTFTRREGFDTEAECKAHLGSPAFMDEVTAVAGVALGADENASMAKEPACVERPVPGRPA